MTNTTTPPPTARRTVRCPTCGHAVPVVGRQTTFCPHCGRQLRAGRGLRPAAAVAAFLLVGAGVWTWFSSDRPMVAPAPAHVVVVADPVDAELNDAQVVRVTWAVDLDHRADDVRAARQALVDQTGDLANLAARITTAVNRAADEDRWPAKVAGRSLLKPDADAVLGRVADAAADERRAVDRDGATLTAILAAAAAERAESGHISQLRHDLASNPTPDRRSAIDRQADVYRDGSAHQPDALSLSADPTRPIDVGALLR